MTRILEVQEILREYSTTQAGLCVCLFEKYGQAESHLLLNIPRSGLLMLNGEMWEFKKHGAGVLFKQLSSGAIFDVHRHVQFCPECFDAWRLTQYFESKGIHALKFGSLVVDAQDESAITAMLVELVNSGKIASWENTEAFTLVTELL